MICIRCNQDAAREIGRLGVSKDDGLVAAYQCRRCRKVFWIEELPTGDTVWRNSPMKWATLPKEQKRNG